MGPMKPHLITEYELYNRHGQLTRRFSPAIPKLEPDMMIVNVMTKNGIIKKQYKQPFASFVANFTRLINYGWMQVLNKVGASANDIIYTHVTGGATTLTADAYHAKVNEAALAPAAPNVYGIMVGDMDNTTGLGLTVEAGIGNVVQYTDYMLRTLLINDGGAPNTDLETRAVNISMPNETTLLISRRFQNDSAADIYVDECCLVGTETDNNEEFMLARDILGTSGPATGLANVPITVEATEILEISYTFTVSETGGLTVNWLKYLSSLLGDAVPVSAMRDITNSAQAAANPAGAQTDQDMTAAQDDDTFGIVIGGYISSDTSIPTVSAFTSADYQVTSKLLDTEIDYGPMVPIAIDLQSTYTQFGMYRDFENDNTTTVYVVDSGLYMKDATLTKYFLMARSVAPGTGVVGAPASITVLPDEILRVKKYMRFNI
jgi:hypothetical protein